ncbi:hypothetical protein [Streptomyces sp. NBC_01538]|uniref:hypothetical protein n=1 Tax=Streptomyces sp. NBC_01538 TaxID=2903897 RepID=UPI003863ABE2
MGTFVVGATALIGLLGAAAGLLFTFFPDLQPKPESKSDVKIESVAVGRIEELHGKTEVPDYKTWKKDFSAPLLDVLLSNSGDSTAYVKSGEFTFFAALDMNQCDRTGGGNIDYVSFPVEVPRDVQPGDRLVKPVFFKVEPGKGESLAFALGPAGDIVSENWLYAFSLNLKVGSASVSVPKSALSDVANWKDQVLEAAAKQMALEGAGREEGRRCYASTLKTVWQVLNEARYVPAGLEEFAIKLEALLAA